MTLLSPRLMVLAAAFSTIFLTVSLGQWQLRRADEKQQAQALLAQRRSSPALSSNDYPCRAQTAAELPVHRPVELTGVWLNERTIWLDNRTQSGRTGFEIVTPLRLHAPTSACDGRLVLIQRGWVERDPRDRLRLPNLPSVTGVVSVSGRLVASVSRVYQLGEEATPVFPAQSGATVIRQNADEKFWRAWLGQVPLPGAVLQTRAARGEDADELRREWPAPDLGRDKHLAYAAQWFALSLLTAGLTVWFQWIRPQRFSVRSFNMATHMTHPDASSRSPIVQFSVHSLPEPRSAAMQRNRMGRIKMLLIWAVCAAPVVASYLSYYVIKPQGRTNHGTIINPTRPMPADGELMLTNLQGQSVRPSAMKGQWLLISVAGGACDAQCERNLYLQRQLREVLGRDKDRVDRVWLITDRTDVRPALLPALAQSWALRVPQANLARWLQPDAGQDLRSHLYLVDPKGDWMMRFPVQADPAKVKKDLLRLLKASESWDEAGR